MANWRKGCLDLMETDEMWTQIGVHLSHFVEIYGMK